MSEKLQSIAEHGDNLAWDKFSEIVKEKMAASRAKGRGGWDDPAQCTVEQLAYLLVEHVAKGDPRDIAILSMMVHQRGGTAIDVYEAFAVHAARAKPYAPTPEELEKEFQQ